MTFYYISPHSRNTGVVGIRLGTPPHGLGRTSYTHTHTRRLIHLCPVLVEGFTLELTQNFLPVLLILPARSDFIGLVSVLVGLSTSRCVDISSTLTTVNSDHDVHPSLESHGTDGPSPLVLLLLSYLYSPTLLNTSNDTSLLSRPRLRSSARYYVR